MGERIWQACTTDTANGSASAMGRLARTPLPTMSCLSCCSPTPSPGAIRTRRRTCCSNASARSSGVLAAGLDELQSVSGIGPQAAQLIHLQAALERRAALRRLRTRNGRPLLNTPVRSARYAELLLRHEHSERLYALCLSTQLTLLCARPVGQRLAQRADRLPAHHRGTGAFAARALRGPGAQPSLRRPAPLAGGRGDHRNGARRAAKRAHRPARPHRRGGRIPVQLLRAVRAARSSATAWRRSRRRSMSASAPRAAPPPSYRRNTAGRERPGPPAIVSAWPLGKAPVPRKRRFIRNFPRNHPFL